ncbi:9485_t:CDS:2 [Entrophospora sp. SA101]|nr:9485_t:CDS:2 [Entrophospora sp. SA101]
MGKIVLGAQSNGPTLTLNNEPPMTREDLIVIVDWYFKPENEEQYGQLNTKWTEWIHRNLFSYFFCRSWHAFFHSFYFTRIVNYAFYNSIPNLDYISEAATSPLVHQLQLNIVPKTEVVWLSSPSFHYDYSPLALCASHNLMVWNMIESIEVPEEPDHMESGNDNNNYQSNNIEIDGARNSLQNLELWRGF